MKQQMQVFIEIKNDQATAEEAVDVTVLFEQVELLVDSYPKDQVAYGIRILEQPQLSDTPRVGYSTDQSEVGTPHMFDRIAGSSSGESLTNSKIKRQLNALIYDQDASTNRMIMVNKLLRLANAITELDVAVLADDKDKHAGKTSWSDSNVNYDLAEMNIRTQLVLLATELK